MTERQKEMAFLSHVIGYDDNDERRELEQRIAQVQGDERCVQRVASGAAICTTVILAVLAYPAILEENFPHTESERLIRVICGLGLASLICLVSFMGVLLVYRNKLNRLREECRQLSTKLLQARLGEPQFATSRSRLQESDDHEVASGPAEAPG